MIIDLVVLGAIGLFALVGAFTGALPQIFHLGGLVLGWLAARLFGMTLGAVLARAFGVHPTAGLVLASLGLSLGVFLAVWIAGRVIVAVVRKGKGPGPVDRAAGVLLGGAKIGLLLYLVVSFVVLFDRPLRAVGLGPQLRASEVVSLARRYNLVAHTGLPVRKLERALTAATKPGTAEGDAALQSLARDPRIRRLSRRRDVQRALSNRDYVRLLQDPDVLELLADPKATQALGAIGAKVPARND